MMRGELNFYVFQVMCYKATTFRGAWVAHSIVHPTSAQVVISRFVSSSPAVGSVLGAWSLLQILCLPLFLPFPCLCSVSFCPSKMNKCKKKIFYKAKTFNKISLPVQRLRDKTMIRKSQIYLIYVGV